MNKDSIRQDAARLTDSAREKASETIQEIKLAGNQLVDKLRELIEEGNVRRVVIKKDERILFELPLTVGLGAGAAAVLVSPMIAAVGAVAALVSDVTLVIERDNDDAASSDGAKSDGGRSDGNAAEDA